VIKQYHGIAALVLLLGLFPAFFLPVLQLVVVVMLIGLGVAFRQFNRSWLKQLLMWHYIVFAQFCVFFFINAAFYPVWESPRMYYRAIALESWSISLVCLVVLVFWLHLQKASDIKRALIVWLPVALTLSFTIATVIYVSGTQGSRVPLFTPNPLAPPFWFLVFAMTSFAWFFEMTRWEKITRFALFLMAGMMAVYGSARLVMLAWEVCGCALAVWFYIQAERKHRPRVLLGIGLSLAVSLIVIVMGDALSGGLLMARMTSFLQVDFTYDSLSQQFLRLQIWTGALSIISDNAWLGIGQVNERIAIQQNIGWEHWFRAHQSYLSYLIAGGMPALISGLLMQSPVLALLSAAKRSALFPAFLGLGVVVTLNCLTDSIFQSGVSVQAFMLTTLLFLRASDVDQPTLAPQKQVSSAAT
jgi:hypothetical protein